VARARGDLLVRLGRSAEARVERAAELISNEAERSHLLAGPAPLRTLSGPIRHKDDRSADAERV
jgi:predicted RNA polymerase sigma factor